MSTVTVKWENPIRGDAHVNDLPSIKARLQDTAFRSYFTFNKDNSSSFKLSKDEFELLCKLKNENNPAIQKADKGNTIVIIRTLI